MFRLSDPTRRLITLALFAMVCVGPLVLVTAAGVWRRLPGRITREESRLSLLLGQPVTIESARDLRPSAIVYGGLQIHDPESDAVLVRCDRLEVSDNPAGQDNSNKRTELSLRLVADKVTAPAGSLTRLQPMINRLLQCRMGSASETIDLVAQSICLEDSQDGWEMKEVRGRARVERDSSQLEMTFRIQGEETPKPVYLRIVRNRQLNPAVDGFDVFTGEGPLPCSLLAAGLPAFAGLGPECRFQGYLVANHTPEGWEGEVLGDFDKVDFEQLLEPRLGPRITGQASIQLQRVRFRAGRVLSAQGAVHARNGRVDRSLIDAFGSQLQLQGDFASGAAAGVVPYEQLGVRFYFDGAGVRLWGQCPSATPGTILVYGYGQRLVQPHPDGEVRPLGSAVAALTATTPQELYRSAAAARLMQRLPLPLQTPTPDRVMTAERQ